MIKCTSFIKGTETKHDSAHRTCKAAIGKGRKIAEHESCSAARALDYQVQVVRFLFNMVKHITTDVGSQVPTTGQFCTLAINHACNGTTFKVAWNSVDAKQIMIRVDHSALQTVTTDHFAAIHGIAVDDTSHSAIAVTDHSAIAVSHAVINLTTESVMIAAELLL